jgi:hypothetical protein
VAAAQESKKNIGLWVTAVGVRPYMSQEGKDCQILKELDSDSSLKIYLKH